MEDEEEIGVSNLRTWAGSFSEHICELESVLACENWCMFRKVVCTHSHTEAHKVPCSRISLPKCPWVSSCDMCVVCRSAQSKGKVRIYVSISLPSAQAYELLMRGLTGCKHQARFFGRDTHPISHYNDHTVGSYSVWSYSFCSSTHFQTFPLLCIIEVTWQRNTRYFLWSAWFN